MSVSEASISASHARVSNSDASVSNSEAQTAGAEELFQIMVAYRAILESHRQAIDSLNVFPVPDGDTGTNMALTLVSVMEHIEATDGATSDMSVLCEAISHGSLMGARGNSGVILSQILRGMSKSFADAGVCSPSSVAVGLENARVAAYEAVLEPREGTILTVLSDMATEAKSCVDQVSGLPETASRCLEAGRKSLDRTPELLEVLKEAGVVDAGGAGLVLFWEALLSVVIEDYVLPESDLSLREFQATSEPTAVSNTPSLSVPPAQSGASPTHTASDQRYEVMYFLETSEDYDIKTFKQAWGELGDSIAVVGGDGLWNCHIHTNQIGEAIEAGIDAGRPRKIRITDLFEQVEHLEQEVFANVSQPVAPSSASPVAISDPSAAPPPASAPSVAPTPLVPRSPRMPEPATTSRSPRQPASATTAGEIWCNPDFSEDATCAVVSVGSGEGICNLLGMLGVHSVVTGGQTMNPSTENFLAAVLQIDSPEILILPNNKNIIMAANEAAKTPNKTIQVLPTHSVPEGVAALVAYDPSATASENLEAMQQEVTDLVVAEVTQAVRNTSIGKQQISQGDFIGISRGEIKTVADTPAKSLCALLSEIIDPDHELLTIFVGELASEADTQELLSWLAHNKPNLQTEIHQGDQPLYHYLISLI